jgi:hypothetical protein
MRDGLGCARRTLLLPALLPLFISEGRAGERHWVGPIGGLWSNPNNWSASQGGPGGAGVPQPGDAAIARTGISARFDYLYTAPGMGVNLYSPVLIEQDVPTSVMIGGGFTIPKENLNGASGQATYNQSAGTAILNGFVQLGQASFDSSDLRGYYTLSGNATLSIGSLLVNHGLYTQAGGLSNIAHASLGSGFAPKPGGIAMGGGTLNIANLMVQNVGASTFSGGHTTIEGFGLFVSIGSVTLSGGSLSVGTIEVQSQAGFIQTGGSLVVANQLFADDLHPFRYNGGLLSAGSILMDDGRFLMSPGGDKVARTRGILTTGSFGKMDLADNAATVDYEPGSSPLVSIRSQVISAHNNGSWTGGGIGSSLADTTTRGVGYAEASSLTSIPTIFGAVDDTTVLVRLTRYGDADLSGFVNLSDFNRLAANFGLTFGAVWSQADFNYDGRVNLSDFNLLASNFGFSATGPTVAPQDWSTLASTIPELTLLLLTACAFALPRRRRCPV